MKTYIPIFFSFLTFGWSQQIIELAEFKFSHLDKSTNSLKLYDNNIIYFVNLSTLDITEKEIKQFEASRRYYIEQLDNKTYLFQNGTGKVFQEKQNHIERVDNSIIDNFLIGSNFFTHNDTVFRHGGYGYWTVFNKIIYYDINTHQWELYKSGSNGRIDHFTFVERDKVYFLGGHYLSTTLPQKDINDSSIQTLNFNSGQFEELGNTSLLINGNSISNDQQKNLFINNERTIFEINFKENKVKEYFSNSLNTKISNRYQSYVVDDKFIFFSEQKGKAYLNIFPVDLFISNPLDQYPLIEVKIGFEIYVYVLVSLISVFLLWKLYKQINTIYLSRSAIKYKFKKAKISQDQYQVLSLFNGNHEVKSIQIDDIIFEKDLSRASNYKKKNEAIYSINTLLKKITASKNDILLHKKSELDSRIKVFYINQQYKLRGK